MLTMGTRRSRWVLLGALLVLSAPSVALADGEEPEPPPPPQAWYDAFDLYAFADTYASVNYNFPKPQASANARSRAFDVNNGFSLAQVGLDVAYQPDPVGGTLGLRFGPEANIMAANAEPSDATFGLVNVRQAFASWKPGGAEGSVTLDFGKYDQPFGAEVADSQFNYNYTRGLLYWWAQPLFFTGLRGTFELTPALTLKGFLYNGWNRTVDNNIGKSLGVQLALAPSDAFTAYLGWAGGPEQDDSDSIPCDPNTAYDPSTGTCITSPGAPGGSETVDRGDANGFDAWRHLVDVVLAIMPSESLSFLVNADYGAESVRSLNLDGTTATESQKWYGAALIGRYALDERWAIAARGEYYADPDGRGFLDSTGTGVKGLSVASGTLTLEVEPTENLMIMLDGRGDFALDADAPGAKKIFQKKARESSSSMITTTLGVIVKTK